MHHTYLIRQQHRAMWKHSTEQEETSISMSISMSISKKYQYGQYQNLDYLIEYVICLHNSSQLHSATSEQRLFQGA